MPAADRVLVIMRHAKAQAFAETDRARTLTTRGRAAAVDVGRWLAAEGHLPDHALVSTAVRTRQTWEAVAEGLGADLEASYDGALYSAGIETAMECLRTAPADARCVLLVGHNPTVASLVQLLGDGSGSPEALLAVSRGFPPAATAVFGVGCTWDKVDLGCARLDAVHVGGT